MKTEVIHKMVENLLHECDKESLVEAAVGKMESGYGGSPFLALRSVTEDIGIRTGLLESEAWVEVAEALREG